MRTTSDQRRGDAAGTNVVSAVERGLFNAALDFYGAAMAVIDHRGPERPRVRWDADGLQDVRSAMAALERRIGIACRAGLSNELIASITRLERDVVDRIVDRQLRAVDDRP